MAVSDLLPRKAMGSKSRSQTLHDRLDYDQSLSRRKAKAEFLKLLNFPSLSRLVLLNSTWLWIWALSNVNLLVDIQAKMQAGKGKGYERWAKVFNLKEAAKTLISSPSSLIWARNSSKSLQEGSTRSMVSRSCSL